MRHRTLFYFSAAIVDRGQRAIRGWAHVGRECGRALRIWSPPSQRAPFRAAIAVLDLGLSQRAHHQPAPLTAVNRGHPTPTYELGAKGRSRSRRVGIQSMATPRCSMGGSCPIMQGPLPWHLAVDRCQQASRPSQRTANEELGGTRHGVDRGQQHPECRISIEAWTSPTSVLANQKTPPQYRSPKGNRTPLATGSIATSSLLHSSPLDHLYCIAPCWPRSIAPAGYLSVQTACTGASEAGEMKHWLRRREVQR